MLLDQVDTGTYKLRRRIWSLRPLLPGRAMLRLVAAGTLPGFGFVSRMQASAPSPTSTPHRSPLAESKSATLEGCPRNRCGATATEHLAAKNSSALEGAPTVGSDCFFRSNVNVVSKLGMIHEQTGRDKDG